MSSLAQAAPWLKAARVLPLWLLLVSPRPALGQDVSRRHPPTRSGTHAGHTVTVRDGVRVFGPRAVPFRASRGGMLGVAERVVPGPRSSADAAVIFDDFRYAEPVDYDPANKSGSSGTVFGPNRWLEGPDIDHLGLSAGETRAWYGFEWQEEFVVYDRLLCGAPPCFSDNTLFDGTGTELETEPVSEAPGHVVMRFRGGDYDTGRLVSPLLTSGFAARTGTWVVRVRLPDFDGLAGGGGVGVLLAPLWLKGPDEAWETRPLWTGAGDTNWWEANIELWREPAGWRSYADEGPQGDPNYPGTPDAMRYLSAGNTWYRDADVSFEDTAGVTRPLNATFGECEVVYHSGSTPGAPMRATLPQADCLDAMIGERALGDARFAGLGHPYVYVLMRNTGERTERHLYVRSEDELGNPAPSSGFESLLLSQTGQSNYVDPGFFNAQLQMLLYRVGSAPSGAVGAQGIDMRFDWFLYTPDTDLTVQEAPDYARAVQRRLDAYNGGRPASEQVWRVNTTGLELRAPRQEISPWATCNPWRIEPERDWDFAVEKTDREGRTSFTVHPLRDGSHDLRTMFQSVEWTVVGGRFAHTVRDEGYTLERGDWGPGARFDITATVTQTSPVVGDSVWVHDRSSECPDRFGPATRRHTYRYTPALGRFYEVFPLDPRRAGPRG